MQGMTLNYVLLAITGIYLIQSIYAATRGGARDYRLFRPLFMLIVFVLVLISSIMGVGYMEFKQGIETGNWDFKK